MASSKPRLLNQPTHSRGGGFDGFKVLSWATAVDDFCLEQTVESLGQGIVHWPAGDAFIAERKGEIGGRLMGHLVGLLQVTGSRVPKPSSSHRYKVSTAGQRVEYMRDVLLTMPHLTQVLEPPENPVRFRLVTDDSLG